MEVIGLTGGIAAGKSTVARRLAQHGAVIIDADALARDAVEPGTPGLSAIRARFGESVIAADGSLDRAALGRLIFSDESARADLNAIVHPEVARLYRSRLADIARTRPEAIVIYDVPLLLEARAADEFALVVVVHAPAEQRIERLMALRGIDRESAEGRIAAQASDEARLAIADVVIDASGTIESTEQQTDALWRKLVARQSGHTAVSDPLS